MKRIAQALQDKEAVSGLFILKDKEKVKSKFKESFGLVYSGRVTSIHVESDDELIGLTHYMLKLALGMDCQLTDALKAPKIEPDAATFTKFLKVVNSFTTHAAKTLYGSAPSRRFVARVQEQIDGITSADAKDCRPLYFSGNAADSMFKYFWTTDFVWNGRRTCMAELIAKEDPVVMSALSEWTFKHGQVEAMVEQARFGIEKYLPDHAYRKQVLLPVYNDNDDPEYLAVTPIPSIALADSIGKAQQRFRNRHVVMQSNGKEFTPFYIPGADKGNSLKFGGTKPQNINDFASSVGGYFPVLFSRIPRIPMAQGVSERAAKGWSLIDLSPKTNPEAIMVDRHVGHRNQIDSYSIAVNAFVEMSFMPILEYADVIQEAYDKGVENAKSEGKVIESGEFDLPLPKTWDGLKGLTLALLSEDRLTEAQVEKYTKAYVAGVQEFVMRYSKMTEMARSIFIEVVSQYLRNWRNPIRRHYG